jgi:single-stranded-DNA-specific exonuclease
MEKYKFSDKLSVLGRKWEVKQIDERIALAIQQRYDLPQIAARMLAERGVALDDIPNYLEPTLKHYMPDPSSLIDMEKAVARIIESILAGDKITVFGDYDVDGSTASSLLHRFFRSINVKSDFYIPDRITEGYGPNTEAFKKIKASGSNLVVTVDCGITSFEPILEAKNIGLGVVIIDHHLGAEALPEAAAIVNPNRIDEKTPLTNLCAVGLAFLLAVAVNRKLREMGYYKNDLKEPNLFNLLDLVALGTVCDVMSLNGLNRAYVAQGLKIMRGRKNLGLAALADIAKMAEEPSVYGLGFVIGPRINAGGRVGSSILGPKLLTTEDPIEAKELATKLNELNVERQEIEKKILEEAINIASHINKSAPMLIVTGYGWHQGIVGIVASRIKDMFDKPCAVITVHNGIGKASSRSVHGVDIGRAIGIARANGLLISGGGHKAAAGFMVAEAKIPEFIEFMHSTLADEYAAYSGEKSSFADGIIALSGVSPDLTEKIDMIGPFGQGNPEPKFIIEDVAIFSTRVFAEKHVSFFLGDASLSSNSKRIKGVVFNAVNTKLGDVILASDSQRKKFAAYGRIKTTLYQGIKKCEFYLEDLVES